MGAWGVGTFENDHACDFAADIADCSNLKKIESAFDKVLKVGTGYLEAPDAEEALAAADIVARLRGKFGQRDAYTEKIDKWAESNKVKLAPPDALVEKARKAVARVTTAPSELVELWDESDDANSWKAAVNELLQRLS
jgi:hypothetical protein